MARNIFIRQEVTRNGEALVSVDAVVVTVLVRFAKVSLIDIASAEMCAVILRGFLVGTLALEAVGASVAVLLALLLALVVTCV